MTPQLNVRRAFEYLNLDGVSGFILFGLTVGAAAVASIVLTSGSNLFAHVSQVSALGQAALLAGASLAVAALVGFLFGVPRAFGAASMAAPGQADATSNLEQISDWLSKMMLGAALVGLTQLPAIWRSIESFAAIGYGSEWGERVGGLIVIYFGVVGFIGGYTVARVQFITLLDRGSVVVAAIPALQRLQISPDGTPGADLTIDELTAIEAFSRTPVGQIQGRSQRRLWAKAQLIASAGDLRAAQKCYEMLLRAAPNDPQLLTEKRAVDQRLDVPERNEVGRIEGRRVTIAEAPSLSPQAAIERMFACLYAFDSQGFDEAIRIGEELAKRVQQDDSMWAYLACAYGQKYDDSLERAEASDAELARIRERALFCVRQALDRNAARWRPVLRALWDKNAIRPDGDDDLVAFSGDPQFAALLDPESVSSSATLTENLAAGIGSALLATQRMSRYSGVAQAWIATADGAPLEGEPPRLRPGEAYRLFMRLVPDAAPEDPSPAGVTAPLKIIDGDDRPRVDFELRPDAIDMRFSPDKGSVSASHSVPTPECDFGFQAPGRLGASEIYVEIAQGRRIVKTLVLETEVARDDA